MTVATHKSHTVWRRHCAVALLIVASSAAHAQTHVANARTLARTVNVLRSSASELTNPATTEPYQLYVSLPASYDSTARYPVLIVLDGDNDFPLAVSLAEAVRGECELKFPPIIVGIGDGAGIDQPGNRRQRDYTPTVSTVSWARGDGGAAAFLTFVERSVLPWISANYATNGQRALFGYSYGGLLAAHALLTTPAIAQTWLLGSPSLFYDNKLVIRAANVPASQSSGSPSRVFLSAGGLEDWAISGNGEFVEALRKSSAATKEIASTIIPGVGHSLGKPEAMLRALVWSYCSDKQRDGFLRTPAH